MKICHLISNTLIGTAVVLFLFSGCEYKGPASSLDILNDRPQIVPTITRIVPAEAGTASEIAILGTNFSSVPEENWVYFNQTKCLIKSCTDTSISVYRPNVVGDSVTIKVSVINAVSVAKFTPYKMEAVIAGFGNFAGADAIMAIAVDQNDNVFLAMNTNDIIRLDSQGNRDVSYLGKTAYNLWTDMKIGSDGYMYLARSNNIIYRLSSEVSDSAVQYIVLPDRGKDRVQSMDFNENGILYGGGKKSDLIIIHSVDEFEKSGYYVDYDIVSVRVYKSYLYVVAEYVTIENSIISSIWRHSINADGTVENQELIIDWSSSPCPDARINDITFSENDVLYISTDAQDSPIIRYDLNTKSYQVLYYGIISSPVSQIVWDNSTHLFAVVDRGITVDNGGQLLKINTGEQGAYYYGR